ncbi:hypothetical protein [Flavobacterium sp.]|uniref:hypothetical protein n=1 Tax=Flavobacterium sp. TaxID=239 RepID=UPI003752B2E2
MEKFEELQSIWDKQSDATPKFDSKAITIEANRNIKIIKIKHFWTIGILSVIVFILVYYYFWIFNDAIADRIIGLQLMIFVLIGRVILEIISIFQFKKIDFTATFKNYTKQLVSFYKFRKVTHFVLTPIIYLSYCFGFISLLPLFKESLSNGFYLYVLISGIGFLVFFSYFLIKGIRQDMNNLEFLKKID